MQISNVSNIVHKNIVDKNIVHKNIVHKNIVYKNIVHILNRYENIEYTQNPNAGHSNSGFAPLSSCLKSHTRLCVLNQS